MTIACLRTGAVPAPVQFAPAELPTTDVMVMRRIAQGDHLAMRTLFARHQLRVYRFVLRLVRNEAMAEDVVSDVFLDVWRQAGRFEARSTVATWLLAMARYKAFSAMRQRTGVELDADTMANIPDPADDPEATLQQKSDAQALRAGLSQLSRAHAEVVDLVYYHGKTISEVADILAVLEATVKTRMFYARKRLAAILEQAVSPVVH
jgi:RNA polymerase sigma-70 factor, ECF subfamily